MPSMVTLQTDQAPRHQRPGSPGSVLAPDVALYHTLRLAKHALSSHERPYRLATGNHAHTRRLEAAAKAVRSGSVADREAASAKRRDALRHQQRLVANPEA